MARELTSFGSVPFGSYEWLVLEKRPDRALLLARDIVEQRDYHDRKEDVTWERSELREYLNTCFFDTFAAGDKAAILSSMNENKDNPWYGSNGGDATEDKIFLLSLDEIARKYFGDSSRLLDYPKSGQRYWFERKDDNNERRKARYLDSSWWWWTRTPGKNNRVATYVHGDGNIGIQGNGIAKTSFNTLHGATQSNKGGVRPALWMNLA